MKIQALVVDYTTKEPLGYFSACFINNATGEQEGSCTMVNSDGYLMINDPLLDRPDISVEISGVGYRTQRFSPEELALGQAELRQKASNTLSDVIITGIKKKLPESQKKYTVPIILGSAAMVTFSIWAYKTWF